MEDPEKVSADLRRVTRALAGELEALRQQKDRDAARFVRNGNMAEVCTAGWLVGVVLLIVAAVLIPGTVAGLVLLGAGLWLAVGSLLALMILRYGGNKVP